MTDKRIEIEAASMATIFYFVSVSTA